MKGTKEGKRVKGRETRTGCRQRKTGNRGGSEEDGTGRRVGVGPEPVEWTQE